MTEGELAYPLLKGKHETGRRSVKKSALQLVPAGLLKKNNNYDENCEIACERILACQTGAS